MFFLHLSKEKRHCKYFCIFEICEKQSLCGQILAKIGDLFFGTKGWKLESFFSLVEFKFVHEFCIIIYKVKQYFHPSSLNHLIMYMRTCNAESQKRSATFWYLVWWPGGSWLSGAAWLGRTRRGRPCCWQCGHTPHLYTHNTINQWKS